MNGHLNAALILIDRIIEELESGFIACPTCGDQEPTNNLDSLRDLKAVKAEMIKAVEKDTTK